MTSPRQHANAKKVPAPGGAAQKYPRAARLLNRTGFLRVYDQGVKRFTRAFTFFYLLLPPGETVATTGKRKDESNAREAGSVRFGITAGKVLGNAVRRNRIKRRTRELLRSNIANIAAKLKSRNLTADVVVHPKKSVFDADFKVLATELTQALNEIVKEEIKK